MECGYWLFLALSLARVSLSDDLYALDPPPNQTNFYSLTIPWPLAFTSGVIYDAMASGVFEK